MLRLKQRRIRTKAGVTSRWYIVGACPYAKRYLRESTGTSNRSEAEAVLAAYQRRAGDEALHGIAGAALFAEAVAEYIGKGGEARFLDPLLTRFGQVKLRDIRDSDLTDLAGKIYPGCKPATLRRQLYVPMQAVWNAAVAAKMAPERTFAKPKVKRKPPKYASDVWLMRLLKAMTRLEQRAAILFMTFSGARASEVVSVRVENHDPRRARVLIENTKNGDAREVALPPFVNAALALLPRHDPSAPLFGYASRFALTRILKRACQRAKIEYLSPHKVGRHAFSARFLADGHSLAELQEAGGWKSLNAVAHYAHLERSQIDKAVANVSTPIAHLTHSETSDRQNIAANPSKRAAA